MKKLVVIPSDPLQAYETAGYLNRLLDENYFNPANAFQRVIILSPLEPQGVRELGNMTVIGAKGFSYLNILNKINPDLVRGYGGFWACDHAVYSTFMASPHTPVYISVHDGRIDWIHDSILYADRIHCTSDAVKNLVLSKSVNADYVRAIPNYVNLSRFYPSSKFPDFNAELEFEDDVLPILHVGRKTEQKNLEAVIAALRFLPKQYTAVFIGRGDVSQYQWLAEKLGVASRCRWIESVPNEELHKWYSWSHVMCTPSRHEGFGIVFIEAMACGANIVTSNIAPLNEFLVNDQNAALVDDYENPFEISKAILKFANREYAAAISRNALESAQRFARPVVQTHESEYMTTTPKRVLKAAEERNLRSCALHYFKGLPQF